MDLRRRRILLTILVVGLEPGWPGGASFEALIPSPSRG
jgi:hypothetical protein